ncbi:GT2 family glycosyltransferase [Lachnotalea glycerini]|uniref:GT2 family glycosyltransferase n=1 Tax=Lachnotalea glycerini TaxID=1763509 RepID=A0A255I2E3_9FIRM|nr:glycosyltransferase family 2 protein [Lachnotalea glycerini]PXV87296.1 GT2 family glycosyltransferase [Lachnotalea glycerini]RDY28873.1 glycosyltransferase family 2 protein [Lachnotalea glycerini]
MEEFNKTNESKAKTEADYYKNLYYKEKNQNYELNVKLEKANEKIEFLESKLKGIKSTFVWKLSKPARVVVHFLIRTRDRIRRCGSLKGVLRKMKQKMSQRQAYELFGTKSFPTEEEARKQRETKFCREIKFSILVPLYNTPKKYLHEMIDSVVNQTYQNWELCLADGSDDKHNYVGDICKEYNNKDKRILYKKIEKNLGISGNTNVCFEMAHGDYMALFDHDDILHPSALYENMKVICEKGADYVYTDEATFHGNSIDNMSTMHFKSDFAIDTLRANNYICHFSTFDAKLLEKTGLFRSEFDGSQDHDMILRLTSAAKNVCHIPKILYYWRSHKNSVASDINAKVYAIDAAKRAVEDHLTQCGIDGDAQSTKAFPTIFKINYHLKAKPIVSIIIANKDHLRDLSNCIESINYKSTYDNYEIIIVENNSTDEKIFEYYDTLDKVRNIRVVKYEGEFNYSAINNLGASYAKGEYIILLNNDTEIITGNWIEELLMYAQREDVGAVGAKLYYEDDTIQHAGIVIGLGAHRSAGHTHYRLPKTNLGYMGKLYYAQDVSAVTGACLMVKKRLFDQLNGLDENFAVALNDVDFCLRLREMGFLNVFTPFAELYHYESKSRGLDDKDEKAKRYNEEVAKFRQRWSTLLESGDPYYNVNFSLDSAEYKVVPPKKDN